MNKIILLVLILSFSFINTYASEEDNVLMNLFDSAEEETGGASQVNGDVRSVNGSVNIGNTQGTNGAPTFVDGNIVNNGGNINVEQGSRVDGSLRANEGENINIANDKCITDPESCNGSVKFNAAGEGILPALNSAEEEVSYTGKTHRLPTTGPTEILIGIIALILAFFVLKYRRKA